ncbi:hypothetical protein ACIP79_08245 [Streptomyces sp. NPDC088747]|uniref:hypothetical protein n=1 Tax=Streptomyces sp. NPDC088747 TaxID=3365886 RepID=UPI0038184B02
MNWQPTPPHVDHLTHAQYSGWNCCWCGTPLLRGARSAGRAPGKTGVHDLSVEVYECGPSCPKRPRHPSQSGEIP